MTTDQQTPVAESQDWVPIREISRITGVNTVTLRAWERRYGLLVPQRTGKGHRLYSQAEIARVKEVQLWLGRGLAISKVKALLADHSAIAKDTPVDSHWLTLAQEIHRAINQFQRKSLVRLLSDTLALYPAEMVADCLILPLLHDLQGDQPGMAARRAFFTQLLLEQLIESQVRQRAAVTGKGVLLLMAPGEPCWLMAQLLVYSLLIHQQPVEFMGQLSPLDAQLAAQALGAKLLVVVGYGASLANELQHYLTALQSKLALPIAVVGDLAAAGSVLDLAEQPAITCYTSQQNAVTFINHCLNG